MRQLHWECVDLFFPAQAQVALDAFMFIIDDDDDVRLLLWRSVCLSHAHRNTILSFTDTMSIT